MCGSIATFAMVGVAMCWSAAKSNFRKAKSAFQRGFVIFRKLMNIWSYIVQHVITCGGFKIFREVIHLYNFIVLFLK